MTNPSQLPNRHSSLNQGGGSEKGLLTGSLDERIEKTEDFERVT